MAKDAIAVRYVQIKPTTEGIKAELTSELSGVGESAGAGFSNGFSKMLGGASGAMGTLAKGATAMGAAVGATATAVGALAQQSTSAFAEFEQLEGGIETLFGTGGKTFEEFAADAKATKSDIENSGIDWDKYANTAWMKNGGINSLFEEMQYNFDEIGTSAEELQEYLHFEYDLDMDDAKAAIEAYKNATDIDAIKANYDSLQKAQDAMMENASNAWRTAGLSANEYMDISIQSAAAMINSIGGDTQKAAELMDMSIVDMMDNVNKMGTSLQGVQDAYRGFSRGNFTMLDNLALGFSGTKDGMQELLDKAKELSGVEYNIDSYADIVQAIHVVQEEMGVAGTTMKEGTETISGSLATLGSAWENLVAGFSKDGADLDKLIGDVVTSATDVLDNVTPVFEKALNGVSSFISKAAPIIAKEIPKIVNAVLPTLLDAAMNLVNSLASSLPSIIQTLLQVIQQVMPEFSSVIKDLMPALMEAVKESSPVLVQIGMQLILDIINGAIEILPMVADIGLQAIVQLVNGISSSLPTLIPTIVEVMLTVVDTLLNNIDLLINAAVQLITGLTEGLIAAMPILLEKMPMLVQQTVDAIIANLPTIIDCIGQIVLAVAEAVIANAPQILAANGQVLLAVAAGIIEAIPAILVSVGQIFIDIAAFWGEKVSQAVEWGKDLIKNFIDGIKAKFGDLKQAVMDLASMVADIIGFSEPEIGPLSNFHTYAPDMMELFAKGIKDNEMVVTSQIKKSFDFEAEIKNATPQTDIALESTAIADMNSATLATDTSGLEGRFGQAVELLGKLVDKDPVEIGANASGIFELVRNQNSIFTKANGRSALA